MLTRRRAALGARVGHFCTRVVRLMCIESAPRFFGWKGLFLEHGFASWANAKSKFARRRRVEECRRSCSCPKRERADVHFVSKFKGKTLDCRREVD